MIMYGTRYILQFDSEKFGHEYKILIKEDGYSGSSENKSLGCCVGMIPILVYREPPWKWLYKRTRTEN